MQQCNEVEAAGNVTVRRACSCKQHTYLGHYQMPSKQSRHTCRSQWLSGSTTPVKQLQSRLSHLVDHQRWRQTHTRAKFQCRHTQHQAFGKLSTTVPRSLLSAQHIVVDISCLSNKPSSRGDAPMLVHQSSLVAELTLLIAAPSSPCSRSASSSHLARLTRCRARGRFPTTFALLLSLDKLAAADGRDSFAAPGASCTFCADIVALPSC